MGLHNFVRRYRWSVIAGVLLLPLSPVLYVLSLGPEYYLLARFDADSRTSVLWRYVAVSDWARGKSWSYTRTVDPYVDWFWVRGYADQPPEPLQSIPAISLPAVTGPETTSDSIRSN